MIIGIIILSIMFIGLIIAIFKVSNIKPKNEIDISSLTSDEEKLLKSAFEYAQENNIQYDEKVASLVLYTIRENNK